MDKTEKLLPVTGADREAMDRLKRFADSPDATIGEHADIATVLALIDRLQSSARGGEVEHG